MAVFQEENGISDFMSGYVGGQEQNPTYEEVHTNSTSHREGVQFFYDPEVISYDEILTFLWLSIDPGDSGGQFVDRGFAYTTAVFYLSKDQKVATAKTVLTGWKHRTDYKAFRL